MKAIIDGVLKFQKSEFNPRRNYYKALAKGQSPKTMMITCSDSRINPHAITQTDPGELFVLRNAGNIVPAHTVGGNGEAGTIEYAVSALGVEDIIICGHSHCGAMAGLLNLDALDDLPATRNWIKNAEATRCVVDHKCGHLKDEKLLLETVKENVLVQLNNLRTLPAVSAGLAMGTLRLHGWVYIIESGEVLSYSNTYKQFSLLSDETQATESVSV
ncbi:MAG TPA: carbonic anhydrase [Gammaproteobacteria bacterium]|nr:carbonic anhydrase [Gammaproteobacteria bacterium]